VGGRERGGRGVQGSRILGGRDRKSRGGGRMGKDRDESRISKMAGPGKKGIFLWHCAHTVGVGHKRQGRNYGQKEFQTPCPLTTTTTTIFIHTIQEQKIGKTKKKL